MKRKRSPSSCGVSSRGTSFSSSCRGGGHGDVHLHPPKKREKKKKKKTMTRMTKRKTSP